MNEHGTLPQQLLAEFADHYMEQLFYFCLKKTGSRHEAEDLASEIVCIIVSSLQQGTIPDNFPAWVWQIARNRCSRWAKKKRERMDTHTSGDIGELDLPDDGEEPLDELIRDETLAVLRRELAFLSSEYRSIVVAHHIKGRTLGEIAQILGLPVGTVKSRLYYARKRLKEGMEMEREFGKLSYDPEEMGFFMCGSNGINGEPMCFIERKLCKNILLAAYRSPSTGEELAIEVGLALPYMEEELRRLVDATLMRHKDGRYETNFIIVNRHAHELADAHLQGSLPELTKYIIDALEFKTRWLNDNCPGWHEGYQPWEDMKWALLMESVYEVYYSIMEEQGIPWGKNTVRPHGGRWDLLGKEYCPERADNTVGCHLCGVPEGVELPRIDFRQYKFKYRHIDVKSPLYLRYAEGKALVDVALGRAGDVKEERLNYLCDCGYLCRTEDGYRPTFCVMFKEKSKPMPPEVQLEYGILLAQAKKIMLRHWQYCRKLMIAQAPEFLREDEHQIRFACTVFCQPHGAVVEEAVRTGYLHYDENDGPRALGAILRI